MIIGLDVTPTSTLLEGKVGVSPLGASTLITYFIFRAIEKKGIWKVERSKEEEERALLYNLYILER
jgi:hypothetical protein